MSSSLSAPGPNTGHQFWWTKHHCFAISLLLPMSRSFCAKLSAGWYVLGGKMPSIFPNTQWAGNLLPVTSASHSEWSRMICLHLGSISLALWDPNRIFFKPCQNPDKVNNPLIAPYWQIVCMNEIHKNWPRQCWRIMTTLRYERHPSTEKGRIIDSLLDHAQS